MTKSTLFEDVRKFIDGYKTVANAIETKCRRLSELREMPSLEDLAEASDDPEFESTTDCSGQQDVLTRSQILYEYDLERKALLGILEGYNPGERLEAAKTYLTHVKGTITHIRTAMASGAEKKAVLGIKVHIASSFLRELNKVHGSLSEWEYLHTEFREMYPDLKHES